MRGKLILVIAAIGLFGMVPQASAAETLYTTPSPGSGSDCSAAKPCALSTALSTAVTGDLVVVGTGTYSSVDQYLDGGKSLTIKGAVIGPDRPVVDGSFRLTGPSSLITDLQIQNDNEFFSPLDLGNGASADRVVAIGQQRDGCYIRGADASITNSVCLFSGPGGSSGMSAQNPLQSGSPLTTTAQNITAIGNFGVAASAGASRSDQALTVTNSIARSTKAQPKSGDVWLYNGMTTLKFTAFDGLSMENAESDVSDKLSQPAVFRSETDFREDSTSPTIDAGSNVLAAGQLDLNGNLRKIGASVDMGAYEYVPDPPSIAPTPATDIAETTATVNGIINTHSGQSYYHLEYGPTAAHGSSTPVQILPARASPSTVKFNLQDLAKESTAHYSIVATNEAGTTTSTDATFATSAPKPPDPPDPGTKPARTAGKVKLSCKRIKPAKKHRVRCKVTQSNVGKGKTRLTLKRVRSKTRVTRKAKLRANGQATFIFKLARQGKYKATIVTHTPAGNTQTIGRTVKID